MKILLWLLVLCPMLAFADRGVCRSGTYNNITELDVRWSNAGGAIIQFKTEDGMYITANLNTCTLITGEKL